MKLLIFFAFGFFALLWIGIYKAASRKLSAPEDEQEAKDHDV